MKNHREAICKRIEAAKIWLASAEQNFINNNSLRGELDLMLAEAEMLDIKKKSPLRSKIFFSINILIIIGVFFSISFIYFSKDDIIFPVGKKIELNVKEDTIPVAKDLLLPQIVDGGTTTTLPTAEIDEEKELFASENRQEIVLPSFKNTSDVVKNIQQIEKPVPILTAEETREMVKLARESLRK